MRGLSILMACPPSRSGLWQPRQALPAQPRPTYRAEARLSGQLIVTFHGDRSAGCETSFRCDVESGSSGGRRALRDRSTSSGPVADGPLFSALSVFSFGEATSGTLAIVRRRAGDGTEQLCADVRGNSYETLPVVAAGPRALTFGLGPSRGAFPPQPPLPTHCGGPLAADVLRGLPSRTVTLRRLVRGPTTIDLSGSTEFAAGGLAGTAVSSIEVRLEQMNARRARQRRPPRRRGARKRPPIRTVRVEYRVAGVSGSARVDVRADARTCAPLDACGLAGSVAATPGPAEGEAYLIAYGRLPKSALRRALGLAPGPRPRKARLYGYVELEGTGTVAAALDRDGTPACRDSVPLRGGTLELRVRGGNVTASFGGRGGIGSDLLGTRCPGPLAADLGSRGHLATGAIPLRAFGRRRLTIHLDRGASLTTTGFELRSRPDLKIELEREIH
jgi:hypothetical protein